MVFINNQSFAHSSLREAITRSYRMDETACINHLLSHVAFPEDMRQRIYDQAAQLIIGARHARKAKGGLDVFLHEYDLSSTEGIALMCLAEALLRIPDNTTIDRLIGDKISTADWKQHLNIKGPLFLNAATWSLIITGKLFSPTPKNQKKLSAAFHRLMNTTGGSLVRPMILQGMKIIGKQFVMGTTIELALKRAKKLEAKGYSYSYDMLGEAARTEEDAENYFKAYQHAIQAVGAASAGRGPLQGPGVSIKLSALHPRYEFTKRDQLLHELVPKLHTLALAAKEQNIGMVIDAEEADRLDISLDIIEAVFSSADLTGWEGFGLAVQSYQKRAPYVLDWLIDLAKRNQRRLLVRLIKGAYWDYEIKQAQVFGLEGYPVFTRKNSTDVSFLACARKMLGHLDYLYPQFGTHNAYSVAAILEMAGDQKNFEFQCLHGMGETLYDQLVAHQVPCRIYAPVGSHKDLLGYLVRRLLENGANTSFINRLADDKVPIEKIIADPIARIAALADKPHPHIPLPRDIYLKKTSTILANKQKDREFFGTKGIEQVVKRLNSQGIDFSNRQTLTRLKGALEEAELKSWESGPIINGKLMKGDAKTSVLSPFNTQQIVGHLFPTLDETIDSALVMAYAGKDQWATTSAVQRAKRLEKAADLFESHMPELIMLLCREGGKHIADSAAEVRETVDYCRYYAARVRKDFTPKILPSPTGEYNQLTLHPRGVFFCISPWNFPLAIFTGQIVAALACGNTVIAKPAEQTPLIAAESIRLLHLAGIPKNALQLLTGKGSLIGKKVLADHRIDGVMFTGSTETAKTIQQQLANREGPIVPFIAETGGQNAMIVDSSALCEQVVVDVIQSAFNSAGQRCSALRVLFVQDDIAPQLLHMLKNAMAELNLGDPGLLSTDIGPVIDQGALQLLEDHFQKMQSEAKLVYQLPMPAARPSGHFFAPCVFEIPDLSILKREVFGPFLHVIRYAAKNLDQVIDAIIKTQYGLTLGIHSRIDATVKYITDRLPVGNVYVNRNIIGAVVGVQPFGGERLSGTGPKAGGPYYLPRLCVERAISINTTAAGGNATLVSLGEE